ncbi:MAG: response regulator [Actinobacteria bacterium]|nr:response regulator [Actinomycetota bacterium]
MAQQTILVVEDDEAIAESVAYHLTRAGHRVLRAGDGAQGLRMFKAQRPDLVILDLMLPQLDGWRFTEEVRSEDQRVPVIVCSARNSEYDRVHGLELGADDYVVKPFSMKELTARVSAQLRPGRRSQSGRPGRRSRSRVSRSTRSRSRRQLRG